VDPYTTIRFDSACELDGSNCFGPGDVGGGDSAPTDATYITQTANGTLSAEQALSALATGLLKNTTSTGVLSIATAGTDYYAPTGTDVALADGGTGASLADPNADRMLFWDDSNGATGFLSTGNGLTITTTSIAADSASTTVDGVVELAIDTEVNTGTSYTLAVTPDSLAASYAGTKTVELVVFDFTTNASTGDGKFYFYIPPSIGDNGGMDLVYVHAQVVTAGTTNTLNIDLDKCSAVASGNVCSGTVVDMLTNNLTVDSGEDDSSTAATAVTINTSNDAVVTGDVIRFNVDAIHSTPSQGGIITLEFRKP
jgi:hypothetical protein